jgi:hypothetical protein
MSRRGIVVVSLLLVLLGGCTTIRTTDPPRTATEQFLISKAAAEAVSQLSAQAVRGHKVWIDSSAINVPNGPMLQDVSFLVGEFRAHLLVAGAQIVAKKDDAQIIVELRTGGVGIDRYEFLIGIPSLPIGTAVTASTGVPTGGQLTTPELAIIKNTRQWGVGGVAYVAYWTDTGEVIASSGPFVGRSFREDWWFFGAGPKSTSDIPTTKPLE